MRDDRKRNKKVSLSKPPLINEGGKTYKQNSRYQDKVGILVQSLGLVGLGVGCTLEALYCLDIFAVPITVGAIVFTIGTKVRGK